MIFHVLKIKLKQLGATALTKAIFFFSIKFFLKLIRNVMLKSYFIRNAIIYNLPIYKKYSILTGLNQNSVAIDLGASVGDVANYIYDKNKCNLECYEPNKICYDLLNKKFANNKKVNTYNLAVSNVSKNQKLYLSNLNFKKKNLLIFSQSSSLDRDKKNINSENFIYVRVININSILNKFKYIDLIKIDIEGAEYKILDKLIQKKSKIGKVVCELHEKSNKQIILKKRILKILKRKKLLNNWFFEWH